MKKLIALLLALVMVGLPDFYQYLAIGVVIFLAVMVLREGKNN